MARYSSIVVALVAVACHSGADCITVPGCLVPLAVHVSITASTTHARVIGAMVRVNGGDPLPCDGECIVPGDAGKYVIDIEAPGFASTQRTVIVTSSTKSVDVYGPGGFEGKSCGCPVVNQQSIDVALVPTP